MDRLYNEELNRRSVYLRIRRRLWILPAAALITAAVFGGIYLLLTQAVRDTRQYQATSKLFIDFAYDEQGQKAHDWFNGATWTDLLTADPSLSDGIAGALPEDAKEVIRDRYAGKEVAIHEIPDITDGAVRTTEASIQAAIQDSIQVQILTDIRLMTVVVTNPDPVIALALRDAADISLAAYGESRKEFDQIELLSVTPAERIVVNSRLRNALLLGSFLGLLSAAFILWLSVVMDDAVYVPEEAERRYGLPVVEVRTRQGMALPEELTKSFAAAREAVLGADPDGVQEIRIDREEGEQIPATGQEDAVLLVIEYGKKCGAMSLRRVSELKARKLPVKGLIIDGADADYLRRYYRIRK